MANFTKKVQKFNLNAQQRFRAIAQTAVQDTVSMAQQSVGEGGRMRVDTGFLRASIQGGLGTMPSGPSTNDGGHGGKRKYPPGSQVAGEDISITLLRWRPEKEQVLFVGWTANYARARESKDGFLRGAVEKWDHTVRKAVKTVGVV